jgi:hypothetical protein
MDEQKEQVSGEASKRDPQGRELEVSKSVTVKVDVLGSKGGSKWPR